VRSSEITHIFDESTTARTPPPKDYAFLFILHTTFRNFFLYAFSEEERKIWVAELSNLCVVKRNLPVNAIEGSSANQNTNERKRSHTTEPVAHRHTSTFSNAAPGLSQA